MAYLKLYLLLTFIFVTIYGCSSNDKNKSTDNKNDSLKSTTQTDSLDMKIGINIAGKEFQTASASDPKEYVVIIYKLINNTKKRVKVVEADVIIRDAAGNEIKKVKIMDNEPISAGIEKEYKALYNYNAFSDKDVALKNVELKDIKFESDVLTIIYDDGSRDTK